MCPEHALQINSSDLSSPSQPTYAIAYMNGLLTLHGEGRPQFTFVVKDESEFERLMRNDPYSLAIAFVKGELDVEGDLIEAIRFYRSQQRRTWRHLLFSCIASITRVAVPKLTLRSGSTKQDIDYHYSQSNRFYQLFLDPRMVYSCGYYPTPALSLEDAQLAKLTHVCRKLDLQAGQRFLDIGCGWGALVIQAAQQYGVEATGCTLSDAQFTWAENAAAASGFADKICFAKKDYRALSGKYDKIASIGMFEHVGRKNLAAYFRTVTRLLASDGLFLNHAIARPEQAKDGPETLFLQKYVFPGGELIPLSDVIRFAEIGGLEPLDVENLRPHYALTCRAWVDNLQSNHRWIVMQTSEKVYRTWLLYLAASSVSFETGDTDIYQVLFGKRGARRRMSRDYMYPCSCASAM